MNQSQQVPPLPRQSETGPYDAQQDELHMSGMSPQTQNQQQLSAHDYAPQVKRDQSLTGAHAYASTSSVPNILQPGGHTARPPVISVNTAPNLPTIQNSSLTAQQQQPPPQLVTPQDYQTPTKPSSSMSHNYSRSSPAAGYDAPSSSYHAYTPTTPVGSSSQYMSPSDASKYNVPGTQRNISNTPLGLADIRPRADSSMSDGPPGYDLANSQAGVSNYTAPWALYAFDWCKWAPQGNGAGKLAVGSYLEDGHNFVCRHHRKPMASRFSR
jgi:DDB1- and CUL4-associated factor 7